LTEDTISYTRLLPPLLLQDKFLNDLQQIIETTKRSNAIGRTKQMEARDTDNHEEIKNDTVQPQILGLEAKDRQITTWR
jgi:hypothetical protein